MLLFDYSLTFYLVLIIFYILSLSDFIVFRECMNSEKYLSMPDNERVLYLQYIDYSGFVLFFVLVFSSVLGNQIFIFIAFRDFYLPIDFYIRLMIYVSVLLLSFVLFLVRSKF